MQIRAIEPFEFETLREIERDAGRRFAEIGMADVADDSGIELATLAEAHDSGLLVGVEAEEALLVGFAVVVKLAGLPHLGEISVRPTHGRRGLGAALIRHVVEALRRAGYPSLSLSTFADIPWNAPFYAGLGFEIIPESALSPPFQALRSREVAAGLDISCRVIMRRTLSPIESGENSSVE